MNWNIHGVLMVLALTVVLTGCGGPDAAMPRLEVEDPVYDFGEQHNRQHIEHTFILRNTGEAPLRILQIDSTCGCTVGALASDVIDPGGNVELTARYNLRGRRGPESSTLVLRTNDPRRPEFPLNMRGVAVEYVRVTPGVLFYDTVIPGHVVTNFVELVGRENEPFAVTEARTETESFEVLAISAGEATEHRLGLVFFASHEPALIQDRLLIKTTHPVHPGLTIPVSAQVAGPLDVIPPAIKLLTGVDTPLTRFIVVRPGQVKTFEVLDVETPHEDIRVQIDPMPNGAYRIRVSNLIALDKLEGSTIRILTDSDQVPEIQIPILFTLPGEN